MGVVMFIQEPVCSVAGNVFYVYITVSCSRLNNGMVMGWPPAYYSRKVPDEKLTFNK